MNRTIYGASLIVLLAAAAHAEDLTVLKPGPGDVPPGRMLSAYLEAKAREQLDARRRAVAEIKTPEDVRERQDEMKARFLEALGGFPEKTPLDARVVGTDRRDGYRVERVIYESRPHFPVTAALYLPDGPPPYPAVLVPCGHSAEGKAGGSYQRICILLAKNGLAALCYDPMSQGERYQLLDADGKPANRGGTLEHTMIGVGALLVGSNAATFEVWDGIRGLDYLATRPDIDASRLGCVGNSGGGTQTAYIMALDDRVAAAAPSCYITSLERLFATIGPQDAEQDITGQVAFGMDHADYITIRAPKPTLVVCGTRDFFDIDGTWDTFREAKGIYGRLGFGERVDLFESDEPHGFTRPRRESSVRWMRRWLLGVDDAIVEEDSPPVPAEALSCTETGQVQSAIPGAVTAFDLDRERAESLARARPALGPDALRAEVRRRLALPAVRPAHPPVELESTAELSVRDGYAIERRVEQTEPGIRVPLVSFVPSQPDASKPRVIYVGADRSLTATGGPIEARVKAGQFVTMVDPRGMGETEPTWKGSGRAGAFGKEEKEAFLALLLGRPLLGQRVFDLLRVLDPPWAIGQPKARYHLIGVGEGGPIALHAALLSDQVVSVELERSLVSWAAVAAGTTSQDQLASVVPGVLESYDLPDLAAALAPTPLTIRSATGPMGKPVDQAALDAAYAAARAAYRDRDAAGSLTLQAGP